MKLASAQLGKRLEDFAVRSRQFRCASCLLQRSTTISAIGFKQSFESSFKKMYSTSCVDLWSLSSHQPSLQAASLTRKDPNKYFRGSIPPATYRSIDDKREYSSSTSLSNLSRWYRIEINNVARPGTTQLTVIGPDIDGILASMTVALAVKGCSLVELHAAKSIDTAVGHYNSKEVEKKENDGDDAPPMIHDIFYVVDRHTGVALQDDELEPLAASLLESLKTPMNIVSVGGAMSTLEGLQENLEHSAEHLRGASQITVIPSTAIPDET